MPEPRVIKRYANRKMYDTARSCYVTLEEVAEMVRNGDEVAVIDNKTKADLTEFTLTQALLDAERRRRGSVPLPGLRDLLAQGGDFLQKRVAEPVSRVREEAQRSVATWQREAQRMLHRKPADSEPAPGATSTDAAPPPEPARRWALHAPRTLEEWQSLLDDSVRHALAGLTAREEQAVARKAEVDELRDQVAALQARVHALEARLATDTQPGEY
ncbi:MAG: hypothetical protein FJ100_15945 [Deltaproteobacteria bacterium]|nr:hypothetical protein [Deltaproteobacteria bacterium]